jgi:hypothetical protein
VLSFVFAYHPVRDQAYGIKQLTEQISAQFYTGKERYRRSGKGHSALENGQEDQEEKERLDGFARWLVEGDDEE